MLRGLSRAYLTALRERPIRTNLLTGGSLGLAGDVICQLGVEQKDELDLQRLFALGCFGMFYSGGVNSAVYASYRHCLPHACLKTPLREGVSCSALDNFLHVPLLYTPAFFLSTSLLRGHSMDESYDSMMEGLVPSVHACWIMWIPLQTVTFSIVPRHLRAPSHG